MTAISGAGNAWNVAQPSDTAASVRERIVLLEISGDDRDGYHLIMSPEGCFTADTWHECKDDALDTAERLFNVRPDDWRPKESI
jgi:hypothetical protein